MNGGFCLRLDLGGQQDRDAHGLMKRGYEGIPLRDETHAPPPPFGAAPVLASTRYRFIGWMLLWHSSWVTV